MATPVQRRPWVDAGSLARTLDPGLVLSADLSGMALIEAVRRSPASEYLLVEPSGQVFGVLAAADLDHAFAGALALLAPPGGDLPLAQGPVPPSRGLALPARGSDPPEPPCVPRLRRDLSPRTVRPW